MKALGILTIEPYWDGAQFTGSLPGQGSFTGNADCNILVMSGQEDGGSCRSDADMILAESVPVTSAEEHPQVFRLDEFKEALARVA